ncbi:MAG TPA: right-handed parallel beta-helix repeat-containing protein [Dongiaceae bacterium]
MNGQPAPFAISRRHATLTMLAGLLAGMSAGRLRADATVPAAQMPAAARPKSILLFRLDGAGEKDGRDWQNAMPIGALTKVLASARPGSGFLIGFDPKDAPAALDKAQIILGTSGEKDNPLFVQAGLMAGDRNIGPIAATQGAALFRSARPWSLADFGKHKSACFFALNDGASHLRISGFRADGTSPDGFFKFRARQAATFDDIVISDIEATNVGRIIETDRAASLQNLLITDCRAVGIVRGFARFRNLSNSTLRNLDLDAANMDAGGRNVCQLISLEIGDNVLFEKVIVRNAVNTPKDRNGKPGYVQGDGIVTERKTSKVTIRHCEASGMGDGGFDLKSTDAVIEDSKTDSCKYGARIWSESSNVIRRCEFRNPKSRGAISGACIQVGGRLQIIDTRLQAGPGTAAIQLHKLPKGNAPMVVMQGGSIETEGDAVVASATDGGVLELHDVVVNGVRSDHRYVFEQKKQ